MPFCRRVAVIPRLTVFLFVFAFETAYPQDKIAAPLPIESEENEASVDPAENAFPVNLDLRALYGQYNSMFSSVNLAQEQKSFVYLLSSSFKRSNDYGYNNKTFINSSYFENKIAFTGNLNVTPYTKSILDVSVDFDSHGMFSNPDFSREEKEKLDVSLKNIHKISPRFEIFYAFGGAYYSHQLAGKEMDDVRTRFSRYNGEMGWEYIWSSSNRLRAKGNYTRYHYSIGTQEDYYVARGEIVDDFYLTNNFAFFIGLNFVYHKYFGLLGLEDMRGSGRDTPVIPIAGAALKGIKFFSASAEYRYDISEFKPEDYYFPQKYLFPVYYLEPSRVHKVTADVNLNIADRLDLHVNGIMKKSDRYVNYKRINFSDDDEASLLGAETVKAGTVDLTAEMNISLIKDVLVITGSYSKFLADSEDNITYKPRNSGSASLKYYGKYINFVYDNRYVGSRFSDPENDDKIDPYILGTLSIQYKATKSVFADLLVENLYNRKYYLRKGYQESGLTVLFGLRVLI